MAKTAKGKGKTGKKDTKPLTGRRHTPNAKEGGTKRVVMRQCAVSKEQLPISQMVRFVLSPDMVVTPDLRCKLPGRGLWLRADAQTISQAMTRKIFARGFKQKVVAGADLPKVLEKLAKIEALHTLSLANKAGLVITGYEKIKAALAKGHVELLLHAQQASAGGAQRLDRFVSYKDSKPDEDELNDSAGASENAGRTQGTEPVSRVLPALFTGEQLSLALGRPNVIHIGLKQGEMTRRFAFALQKLVALETDRVTDRATDKAADSATGSTADRATDEQAEPAEPAQGQ